MPTYSFKCNKCDITYEELTKYRKDGDYSSIKCPDCDSGDQERLPSVCNYAFAQPEGTKKWDNQKTGHDYRFKHKLPKVLEERKNAEIAKLNGETEPYNKIDDFHMGEGVHDPETRPGLA